MREVLSFVARQIASALARIQGRKALELQMSYFQKLFEHSPAGIAILDGNDIVVNANLAFEKIFQYTVREIKGQHIGDIVVPEPYREEAAEISAAIRNRQAVQYDHIRRIDMKHLYPVIIALCLFIAVQASTAQERSFGLGIIVGEPTGLSAKLWTSSTNAFDFGLGWSIGGDRIGRNNVYYNGSRVHFHMDYLWHSFDAIHSSERFPLYYGIGGRINTGAGYDASVAIRGVIGIAWMPHETPVDIFLEIVPSLQLTNSSGFAIDAGLGARYYF